MRTRLIGRLIEGAGQLVSFGVAGVLRESSYVFNALELMVSPPAKKVLIVDDETSMIRTISEALEPLNFQISAATDGNHGLACLELDPPDLVILDLMMPKRSGLLLLESLRAFDNYIPAIMVTGNPGQRHREYAEMLGVEAYLTKPIRTDLLLRTVKRILEESANAFTD